MRNQEVLFVIESLSLNWTKSEDLLRESMKCAKTLPVILIFPGDHSSVASFETGKERQFRKLTGFLTVIRVERDISDSFSFDGRLYRLFHGKALSGLPIDHRHVRMIVSSAGS